MLRCVLARAALCLVLTGIALLCIYGILLLSEAGLPFVNFSQKGDHPDSDDTPATPESLRFAIACVLSPQASFSTYRGLVQKISEQTERSESIILRPSYNKVREGLERDEIDVAFVCTGTLMHARESERIEFIAQPELLEGLKYMSLLIVPADSPAKTLDDLKGKTLAFTDRESNAGHVLPSVMMVERGINPNSFFGKIVYTGCHDRAIFAVAQGVVDIAAVSSLVWESMKKMEPSLDQKIRILWKSPPYGPPCIAAPRFLEESLKRKLTNAFLTLHEDEEGKEILSKLGIQRFVPLREEDYRTAQELHNRFIELRKEGRL